MMTNPELRKELEKLLKPYHWDGYQSTCPARTGGVCKCSLDKNIETIIALFTRQHRQLIPEEKPLLGIKLDAPTKSVVISRNQGFNSCRQQMLDKLDKEIK